ncbi:NAD(P)/FAD-dependent oxidoreductase [Streptomyces sp. So13.3]|uniref:NAD(P)/FAD-dependent oxidoreductase n=1 Tax=Streptomyces TaxID=1883 RepID=UPI001106AAC7|nr:MULTISPECIES: NAD(P)/FAD-dependent oxidoreductase [unclassified Streptomyces]MCZ4101596.1 NAD(P)/FAD-dependent oxidoreductase [Streptomyces sp. H39-C1]QNA76347.1 NAD(P)/FAD-dependent oxidoreductase [Streptomyces sp. So13.3]
MHDVIIIGGGPAGLSAALTLGRSRRTALVCDAGAGRNRSAPNSHGFLTRDGMPPDELRTAGRKELAGYDGVELRDSMVLAAEGTAGAFTVGFQDGSEAQGRRLLLATGMIDRLPDVPGLAEIWGVSAFNCTYCDGYEAGGRRVAVLGGDSGALRLAVQMFRLCEDLVLCTGGAPIEDEELLRLMVSQGMGLHEEPIDRLDERGGRLRAVVFDDGDTLECDALFLRPFTRQGSRLPEMLGCTFFEDGSVVVNDFQQTSVQGVFAAGDLARREGLPFAATQIVHAASAGALSAVVMDQEFLGAEMQHLKEAAIARR